MTRSKKDSCIWKDESKEDMNTTKFLELLLKYNYMWFQNKKMKLNLTEAAKSKFLKECDKSIEYIDEKRASLLIEIIRRRFKKEFFRLQKCRSNDDTPRLPWFFRAYQLFQKSSTSKVSSITCSSIPTDVTASYTSSAGVPALKIMNSSTLATASSLSTPTVKPLSWTTRLPDWKLPTPGQEKQLANPSFSQKSDCDNERFLRNVKPQYHFPVLYPVCILPCASLGRFGESSGISCSRNESKFLPGNEIPINHSPSFHPHISEFSHPSDNYGIPNSTNSCHLASHDSNIHLPSQPTSHLNTFEPNATSFITSNFLTEKFKNSTNDYYFEVSSQSSTNRTSTVFCGRPAQETNVM